jgi:hypothetical protein
VNLFSLSVAESFADFGSSIGKGGLKTTQKLLTAVALGKQILSDDWAFKSAKEKKLLDTVDFIARDEDKEKEWNLPVDWSSGQPRTSLLSEYRVFVTTALKKQYGKSYASVEALIKALGAKNVSSTAIRKDSELPDDTIVLALPQGDLDAITLHDNQTACYDKELIPISILRGQLSLDDFTLKPAGKKAGGRKKSKA